MNLITVKQFHSEALNNVRDLHIYLPDDYGKEDRSFPVLYAHDGQNVFHRGYNGQSWELHRTCRRLAKEGLIEEQIIVAVENAGHDRNSEFAHRGPHEPELDYPCRGEKYERFLIEELKPYIDRMFHTRTGSGDTALIGSSRGGLVTFHIGFNRPDIFGKIAILSPYFAQYNEDEISHRGMVNLPHAMGPQAIWIDAGGMEGMTLQPSHVREVVMHLLQIGYRSGENLAYYFDPLAPHNEEAWAGRVHAPLLFLFGKPRNGAEAVSIELQGPDEYGCSGWLNPIARFADGFVMTDLDARISVDPPELGAVASTGHVAARQSGDVVVAYTRDNREASRAIRFVPHLPDHVTIRIEADVPEDTSSEARIHAGFELYPAGGRRYMREVRLPRGTGFIFRISDYGGWMEADEQGRPVYRQYEADRDLNLAYEVQAWTMGQKL